MDFSVLLSNLTNPTLLFFVLGIVAFLVKSDLEIPPTTIKFISLYLLFAIGFRGGQELAHEHLTAQFMGELVFGMAIASAIPVYVFFLLKRKLGVQNAGAIAAAFGSVSGGTFCGVERIPGGEGSALQRPYGGDHGPDGESGHHRGNGAPDAV